MIYLLSFNSDLEKGSDPWDTMHGGHRILLAYMVTIGLDVVKNLHPLFGSSILHNGN